MANKKVRHRQSRYFTVMLIPDSSSQVRSIKIPHWVFYIVGCFVLTFVVLIAVSRYQATTLERTKSEHTQLLEEKEELESEKEQLEESMAQEKDILENKLNQFEDKADDLQKNLEELEELKEELYDTISNVLSRPGAPEISLAFDPLVEAEPEPEDETPEIRPELTGIERRLNTLSVDLINTNGEFEYLKGVAKELEPFIDAYPSIWPVPPVNPSGYGERGNPFGGGASTEMHKAIDLPVATGTEVKATGGGVVTYSAYNTGGYGYLVIIDHGFDLQTYYAHNSSLLVSEGDTVERGQVIALAGSTGRSTGPHVHYEVRLYGEERNPEDFIEE